MGKNIVLITQARLGSSRFPRKIFKKINNEYLLEIHLNRLKNCKMINNIIVATTDLSEDNQIENKCRKWGFTVFRGSKDDVLDRFYQAAIISKAEYIVRVTSDCPLIDPSLVDDIVNYTLNNKLDYCSNTLVENYPDGQDVEVFSFKTLKTTWLESKLLSEREHVTPYIKVNSSFHGKDKFKSDNYVCEKNYNHIRMTVDEKVDLKIIKILIKKLGTKCSWVDYVNFIENNNINLNQSIIRNEGYLKSIQNEK